MNLIHDPVFRVMFVVWIIALAAFIITLIRDFIKNLGKEKMICNLCIIRDPMTEDDFRKIYGNIQDM